MCSRIRPRLQAGDQPEGAQEKLAGAFLHNQDHAPIRGPGARLVALLDRPLPRLVGRPAHRALQVGLGQPIQGRVAPETAHIGDAALLQGAQGFVVGEAGVHAGQPHLAEMGPGLVHHRGDPGRRLSGRMGLALAQPGPDEIPGLGDRGDERVVDPAAEVAVVGRAGLVAGHVDGHAVEVQGQAALAVAAVGGSQALAGHSQDRLVQHGPVGLGGQGAQQPGQRRLRGRNRLQRAQAPLAPAGDPQQRIAGLALDVGQIAPALGEQAKDGAQLIGQGMHDLPRIPGIGEALVQKGKEPGALQDLADQQQASVAALVVVASLDYHGPVER